MIDIEVEGFDELVDVMRVVPDRAMRELPRIGRKGAQNVKTEWATDVSKSRHFGQIARTINYDEKFAFGSYEAEVGPDRSVGRRPGKRSGPAGLAGIGTFGGANGGGGTLPNPDKYIESEGPRIEQAMSDLVDKVLGR